MTRKGFEPPASENNGSVISYRTKIRRTKYFGGQKCQKYDDVPKILSAENFCPPKILSVEILSDKVSCFEPQNAKQHNKF